MRLLLKYLLPVVSVLFIVGCSTDTLVEMVDPLGVEQLITSVACDEGCGIVADCEGDRVSVTGMIDGTEVDSTKQLWPIYDLENDEVAMELEIPRGIGQDLHMAIGGRVVTVVAEGILDAYDSSAGTECIRRLLLRVENKEDIMVE